LPESSSRNPKVFISYAHVDNQPPHGQSDGWISHLVQNLRNETNRRMGRADDYELWMDFRLKTSDAVTPEIEKQLQEAEVLIVLMSRGWLRSEWCIKELEYFCEQHCDAINNDRVFIIDQDGLPRAEKPQDLCDLLTVPFYQLTMQERIRQLGYPFPQSNNPDHQPYFDRVFDLSHQLRDALEKFAEAPSNRTEVQTAINTNGRADTPHNSEQTNTAHANSNSAQSNTDQVIVYVAPVNDTLYDQRISLISELEQFGIQALPTANKHEVDIQNTLKSCTHFVQLLDENYAQGIPFGQHFVADDIGLPIMQWRDPALDTKKISNPEQKELLDGSKVIASELSDFIRQVRDAVTPEPEETETPDPVPETSQTQSGKTVFVHASPDDFDHARQVAHNLKAQGWGIAMPRYNGDAARIRKSIERGFQHCDILLVLQKLASADVIEDYLADAQIHSNKAPVLICQDNEAEELFFVPHGVKPLTCNSQFEDDCLKKFLTEMQA